MWNRRMQRRVCGAREVDGAAGAGAELGFFKKYRPRESRFRLMRKLPVLPPMQCDDGCGECCGPVPASVAELAAIRAYIAEHGVVPKEQGITCPFYQGGRCQVYPVRPTLCRAFGHTAELRCSRGHGDTALGDPALRNLLRGQMSKGHRLLHSFLKNSELGQLRVGPRGPVLKL